MNDNYRKGKERKWELNGIVALIISSSQWSPYQAATTYKYTWCTWFDEKRNHQDYEWDKYSFHLLLKHCAGNKIFVYCCSLYLFTNVMIFCSGFTSLCMPGEKKQIRRVSYTHVNHIKHICSGYKRTKWFDVTLRLRVTVHNNNDVYRVEWNLRLRCGNEITLVEWGGGVESARGN